MNLPNRLTILRVALVPVFLVFMLISAIPHHHLWALVVFVLASLTDAVDGKIARKRGLVTDFGKFMDPLADKVLVMSAMLCFVQLGWAPAVAVILILAREFLVTSLRLVAAGRGIVISADIWGKAKTVTQMIWVILALFWMWISGDTAWFGGFSYYTTLIWLFVVNFMMWLSVLLTILSGWNYLRRNLNCLKNPE